MEKCKNIIIKSKKDLKYIIFSNLKIYYKIGNLETYPPKEDSFLLFSKTSEAYGEVLDMGTGSGIISLGLLRNNNVKKVVCSDICKDSLIISKINVYINFFNKINKITFIKSDLFENIKGKFDFIFFNPPYLPKEEGLGKISKWIVGGKKGYELALKFLFQAKEYLKDNGKIFLILSSLSSPKIFENKIKKYYSYQILKRLKFFFEEIYLYEIRKR